MSIKSNKIRSIFIYGLLGIAAVLAVTGYSHKSTFKEADVYIRDYKKEKVSGVEKDFAVLEDEDGNFYKTSYNCLNGAEKVGSRISIYVNNQIITVGYIFSYDRNISVKSSSAICVKYWFDLLRLFVIS